MQNQKVIHMQRMETRTMQKNKHPNLDQRLYEISKSLNEILEELQSNHRHNISKKAKRSIEQNLMDLKQGKGIRYKSMEELDKALN